MISTPIRLTALAVLLAAPLATSPAMAQKIAPSRLYNDPDESPRAYIPPRQPTLDKSFGLPTYGSPDAAMPKQRTLATPRTQPPPDDAVPRAQPEEAAPPLALPAPDDAALATPMGQDATPDFFARDRPDDLPLPSEANHQAAGAGRATGAGGLDTPLFTTGPAAVSTSGSTLSTGSALDRTLANRPDPLFTTGPATVSSEAMTLAPADPARRDPRAAPPR